MTRAQITLQDDEAGRTTVTFRPTPPVIAPLAWLWCVSGGLALGLAGAVAITVLDLWDALDFGALLAALTVPGALLIYVVVRLTTRPGVVLHLSFDVFSGFMTVARRKRQEARYTVSDVGGFRLVQTDQRGCLLIMDTRSQGELLLISTRQRCAAPHGLQEFVDRLNLAHDSTLHEMHAMHRPRTPVQSPPGTVISPADARRRRSIRTDADSADPYDSDPHRPAGLPAQLRGDEYD